MGRNKQSIKYQLNQRLNSLMRIGEKKEKETPGAADYNPNRASGVHSLSTLDTYRSVINGFAEHCREQGVKNISDITKETVESYMLSRKNLSAWTNSKCLSAINKVLDTRYRPSDFGLAKRETANTIHNKGLLNQNHSSDLARNQVAIWMANCCGARRADLMRMQAGHAIRNEGGTIIGFHIYGSKNGKDYNVLILPSEREKMTAFVDSKIAIFGENCRLVENLDRNSNPHFWRHVYAGEIFEAMREAREKGEDIYCGQRDVFINQERYERALETSKYKADMIFDKYDRFIVGEVSQMLAHFRIDTTILSYLEKN
jgi:hypothetical protein